MFSWTTAPEPGPKGEAFPAHSCCEHTRGTGRSPHPELPSPLHTLCFISQSRGWRVPQCPRVPSPSARLWGSLSAPRSVSCVFAFPASRAEQWRREQRRVMGQHGRARGLARPIAALFSLQTPESHTEIAVLNQPGRAGEGKWTPFIFLFMYLWAGFICLLVLSHAITTLLVAVFRQVLYLAVWMLWPNMLWFVFSVAATAISKCCRSAEVCESTESLGGALGDCRP